MSAVLRIRDEFFGTRAEEDPPEAILSLASQRVSPREIIRQRVFAEVAEINDRRMSHARRHERTRSLLIDVEDGSAEQKLNHSLPKRRQTGRLLDAEAEFAKALEAFEANRFVMLFDDRQVGGLEDDLTVMPGSEATFLHLTPLKGG